MVSYAIRRLSGAIPTLFIAMTVTFFVLRLAPGGPFDTDRAFPPEVQANIAREYGLDKPLPVQYFNWLGGLLRGDLHTSFQYLNRPVSEVISQALPISIHLGFWALLFAALIGIPLGAVSASRQNGILDHTLMFFAVSGISLPSYLIASLLILTFSLWLGWLPPALWEEPSSVILPALALGWRPMAMIARLTRTAMIDAFKSDYIRTAYSKGLSPGMVTFKHVLRNSLIPVISLMGPLAANLVTGSFLVESIFQIPGLGKHFVQSVMNRDYPMAMGVTVVYGVILILSNLLVDLTYAWADPRIRLEH